MPASARIFLLAACLLPSPALADSNGVYLPPAPGGPGGEDSIETASGTRCRQSINSNGAYLDIGMTGTGSTGTRQGNWYPGTQLDGGNQGTAYARITMPLGRKPSRIDCSRLYELELARMKREIELLEMAAE